MFGSNTSGGLFGNNSTSSNTSNNQGTSGGGFSFGSSSNTGGGLFGNNNTGSTNTGGGLFGSNSNANNNSTGPTNPAGTFGGGQLGSSNNANNNASTFGGGLFGNKSATTGSSGGTGLFGSTNSTPSATNTSGSLFGNTNANSNTSNSASSGGLFGNTNNSNTNNQASGGLFGSGNTNTNSLSGGTGGLFGNNSNAASNTTPTTGGLFGSGNNNAQNNQQSIQSGGLFGNNNRVNTQQQPQQGNLFTTDSANNSQPSFGWNQGSATQTNNSLVNTNSLTTNSNNFNNTSNNNNNSNNNSGAYTPAIHDQLIKIKEQWDPNSPKCVLKTHFYNKMSEQEIHILLSQQRPANETHEDWESAMGSRPSSTHYPIKITSFNDVAQRIEVQLDHVAKSRILLNSINEKQNALSSKHDLDNTTRIMKAKAKHTRLSRRLLRLATILAILKLKGYPLLPEEEEISKQFELLNSRLNDPNSPISKLNDIFARLTILKDRADDLNSQFDSSIKIMNETHSVDNTGSEITNKNGNNHETTDEVVQKLTKMLLKQQMGLNYLNDILERDSETVDKLVA